MNKKKVFFYCVLWALPVIFVIVLDHIVGKFYDSLTPDFGRNNLELALNNISEDNTQFRVTPHPYLTYELTPEYESKGFRQHNKKGYRNVRETSIEKSHSTIRILALGGSTTYGSGVSNPADSWPLILEQRLNKLISQKTNLEVEVINGGIPWGTSAELLNHYLFRDRYLDPDIVILHTGGNDIGPLKHNDYTPEYVHWRTIRSGKGNFLRPGEKAIIQRSNVIKTLYAHWYEKLGYAKRGVYIHTQGYKNLTKEDGLTNVTNNNPIGFQRNLALLIRNIREDGATPIYFQFYSPGEEMFTEEGKRALEQANRKSNFEELFQVHKIGLEKNKAAAKRISNEYKVQYVEIQPGSLPVGYLVDQCHLDKDGQLFKAEFMEGHIMPFIEEIIGSN